MPLIRESKFCWSMFFPEKISCPKLLYNSKFSLPRVFFNVILFENGLGYMDRFDELISFKLFINWLLLTHIKLCLVVFASKVVIPNCVYIYQAFDVWFGSVVDDQYFLALVILK